MPPFPDVPCQSVRLFEDDITVDVGQDEIELYCEVQRFQGSLKYSQPLLHTVEYGVPAAGPDGIAIDIEGHGVSSTEEESHQREDPCACSHVQDRLVFQGPQPLQRFYAANGCFVKAGTKSPPSG